MSGSDAGPNKGVWDALLQALVDLGLTDDWRHMIDSTTVCGHVSAPLGLGALGVLVAWPELLQRPGQPCEHALIFGALWH